MAKYIHCLLDIQSSPLVRFIITVGIVRISRSNNLGTCLLIRTTA